MYLTKTCQKEVTKQEISRFFLLFLLDKMIWIRTVPFTNGSGSRRPKIQCLGSVIKFYFASIILVHSNLGEKGRIRTSE
jgi:hypothetical protein